jgi:NAD(P)-dependent dehydrogenase (short-subunit alcohol dehydrogenase family)
MSENLRRPVYVLLGAAGGIGSALARQLAAQGAYLLLAGRREEGLAPLADQLGARYSVADLTVFAEVERVVGEAVTHFGRLDGVANCVGSLILRPAHATSEADWQATVAANLTSAFATVRAAARAMLKEGGSIALVSTAAARAGFANHEAIAAAKGGVIGLTLAAAATYAPNGIRVNAVAPGLVETPLTARLLASEAARATSLAMHPLGRLGTPDDVASALAWLLDPAQAWVTGQILGVDGGLATVRPKAR